MNSYAGGPHCPYGSSSSSSSTRCCGWSLVIWGDHVELLFAPVGLLRGLKREPVVPIFFKLNRKFGSCIYIFNYACPIFKFNFNILKKLFDRVLINFLNAVLIFWYNIKLIAKISKFILKQKLNIFTNW